MNFVCDGLTLSEAVMKVSKACSIRSTAPIMECIKLSAVPGEVALVATDGEISIRKTMKAEVLEEGEVCVPGKLFADFTSKLTGEEIGISVGEKGVAVKYRDSVSFLQALPADDFPKINFGIGESSFVMTQTAFKRLIAETVFCCAQDDSRPILKGCLLEFGEEVESVALDGYRLASTTAPVVHNDGVTSLICPARTLSEIARMLPEGEEEITLYTQGGMLLAGFGDLTIVSRLYQGEFIKKQNVVPQKFTTVTTFPRAELMASCERAAIVNRGDKNNLVTLTVGAEDIKISSASDYGNVSETVPAETEGVDLTISMNAKFLLDALKALGEEKATASFNGAVSPFIVQNCGDKHSLYLILPVRNVV